MSDETTTGDDTEKTTAKRPSPTSRARRIGGRPTPRPATEATDSAAADTTATAPEKKPAADPVAVEKTSVTANTATAPVRTSPTASPATESEEPDSARRTPSLRWIPAGVLGLAVLVLLVLLVIASHGVYWAKPDNSAGSRTAAQEKVLAAAKKCFAQINTYDYRHLDGLIKADLACTTGTFTADVRRTLTTLIIPKTPKLKAAQTAQVNKAGITSISPSGSQAVVLIYGQIAQSNNTTAKASPRVDVVGAVLTLDQVKGSWLIAKVDTDVGA